MAPLILADPKAPISFRPGEREKVIPAHVMTRRGPRGACAENVAYGCKESACVIQQWVNSSGHRKNMLIPSLSRHGLASATSPSGKKYWTLLVGE